MSNKTNILTKELVNAKMKNLHFTFEEHYWQSYMESDVEVKPISKPSFNGISPKLLAIPAVAIVAVLVIYFSVSSAHSQNNTKEAPKNVSEEATTLKGSSLNSTQVANPTTDVKPEVKEEPQPSENNTNPPAVPVASNSVNTNSNIATNPAGPNNTPNQNSTTNTARVIKPVSDSQPGIDSNNLKSKAIAETNTIDQNTDTSSYQPIPASQYLKKKHKKPQKLEMPEAAPEDDNIIIPEN